MQLFALRFNGGVSFDEFMQKCVEYNLPVLFAYSQFSSTPEQERFTAVFLNDVSVEQPKAAEIMLDALLVIFPEADPRCKDVCQIYFGGKRLLHFDESMPTINIEFLIRNMCLYLKDRYGDNYKRKVIEFFDRTGVALTDKKMLDVSVVEPLKAFESIRNESLSPMSNVIYIIENGSYFRVRRTRNYLLHKAERTI